jgi:hypothetical protein
LASRRPSAYLEAMSVLRRFNPFRAVGDLRRYLAARQRHEVIFLFVSLAAVVLILSVFVAGSQVEKPYKPPDIIYVQSWRADRSDADIIAQQKIDAAKKKIQDAKEAKFEAEKRAAFKRASDTLRKFGI